MENGASSYRRFREYGDSDALAEIIRNYKDGLILYLNGFVNNINTADDLAEDTFVKLVVKRPVFSDTSSFKTWLYTIGRNLAIDHLRKNGRNRDIPLDSLAELSDEEQNVERTYLREEQKITVHRAMRGLKAEYRQILWLTYFEDFSAKEAAKVMKKSVGTINVLVHRARLSLRAQLETEGFTYEEL